MAGAIISGVLIVMTVLALVVVVVGFCEFYGDVKDESRFIKDNTLLRKGLERANADKPK